MRMLIVTQVVDSEHPILGFFHRWIEEFARQAAVSHVVGLMVGKHALPNTVHVHSLGKEKKSVSSFRYTARLVYLSWKFRREYDVVFVHMNPEYVLAAGWVWRLMGKKIFFWYAHGSTSWRLRIAALLAHKILTSTGEGFRLKSSKVHVVGQGIDTSHFRPSAGIHSSIPSFGLVTVGRIARSKRLETLLRAVRLLKDASMPCSLTIVGSAHTKSESEYERELRAYIHAHGLEGEVNFIGPVSQKMLPERLTAANFFISDGATGSLDKALLEAAACGLIVISSNRAFAGIVGESLPEVVFPEADPSALAARIRSIAPGNTHIREVEYELLVVPNTISGLIANILKA